MIHPHDVLSSTSDSSFSSAPPDGRNGVSLTAAEEKNSGRKANKENKTTHQEEQRVVGLVTPQAKQAPIREHRRYKVVDTTTNKEILYFELLLPGATLEMILKEHQLYFTYDPFGLPFPYVLPDGYCTYCRCPLNYCHDVHIAKIPMMLVRKWVRDAGMTSFVMFIVERWFYGVFREQVYAKALVNEIYPPMSFKLKHVHIPLCVQNGTLANLKAWLEECERKYQPLLDGENAKYTEEYYHLPR